MVNVNKKTILMDYSLEFLFYINFALAVYIIILSFCIKYNHIKLNVSKKAEKLSIEILCWILFCAVIEIFLSRYTRRNKIIELRPLLDKYYNIYLTNAEKCDLTYLEIFLLSINCFLLSINILLCIAIIINWLKAKKYIYHVYCYNNTVYRKLMHLRFDLAIKGSLFLSNMRDKTKYLKNIDFLDDLAYKNFYVFVFLNVLVKWVPLIFLVYDVLDGVLNPIFGILPWLFVIILIKNLYSFYFLRHKNKKYKKNTQLTDGLIRIFVYEQKKDYFLLCNELIVTESSFKTKTFFDTSRWHYLQIGLIIIIYILFSLYLLNMPNNTYSEEPINTIFNVIIEYKKAKFTSKNYAL